MKRTASTWLALSLALCTLLAAGCATGGPAPTPCAPTPVAKATPPPPPTAAATPTKVLPTPTAAATATQAPTGDPSQELFEQAEADYAAGRLEEALAEYEELSGLDADYSTSTVLERLYTVRMALGRALLEAKPPAVEQVPNAGDHFEVALALKPGDNAARREWVLTETTLHALKMFEAGRWSSAVHWLRAVFDQEPDYLGGMVADSLYEAYLRHGVQILEDSQDCRLAYEQYVHARRLPVVHVSVPNDRLVRSILACLPTPTGHWGKPTPPPTPMDLSSLHNQILFKQVKDSYADYQGSGDRVATLWVMEPDGTNRRRIGPFEVYRAQYEALEEQHTYSPDRRYRVYTNAEGQIAIQFLPSEVLPAGITGQLTHLSGICSSPVWSPDGGRIAFVSDEKYSDDIWVLDLDASNVRFLTANYWEWDKHPSWSPDAQRIAFWSNRNGLAQIYVMDAEGRYPTNISRQSDYHEWDPLWIR